MAGEHDGGVSLPEDIIFDVLARLPAKPLCRLRCVCKGWRDLISEPTFVTAQGSRTGPYLIGVFSGASRWPPEVRVMDMDGNVVRVLEVRPLCKNDDSSVQQHQTTTRLTVTIFRKGKGSTAMIIDPAAGHACTLASYAPMALSTFGRGTPSGALKVIFLEGDLSSQICMVATIMDGGAELLRWRQTLSPPFVTSSFPQRKATVNGVMYFLSPPINKYDAASSSGLHHIAAFDLEREEWKTINLPTLGIQEDKWYLSLTELKGTLGFVQSLRERNDDEHYYAIVWLLIDIDKSVWVKEYTILMPKRWVLTKQLVALDDGRILLQVNAWETNYIDYHHRDFLVFYNISTRTFTEFMDKVTMGATDTLVVYTGSLLS